MKPKRRRYSHILDAMRPGDEVYLAEKTTTRLDRQIAARAYRMGRKATTANFVAVNGDPASAHRVVRVTMLT